MTLRALGFGLVAEALNLLESVAALRAAIFIERQEASTPDKNNHYAHCTRQDGGSLHDRRPEVA